MGKPKLSPFQRDLQRYGPMAPPPPKPIRPGQARSYCRRFARRHHENFTVASRMLPGKLKQHFFNIYAYCRWADDLADETPDPQQSLAMLGWWENHLRACYQGQATHPVFIALMETVERYEIPIAPFVDLLVAFRQDQQVRKYETIDQLLEYCRYSANPVGRLVLHLTRSFDEETAHLSDCICTGLQLINFWQDIASDLDKGRIYVPQVDAHRFEYQMTDFQGRRYNDNFCRLMEYEVDLAEAWIRRGIPLINKVRRSLQNDVALFVHGGLAVAEAIRNQQYDVWSKRPTLSKIQKMRLGCWCWWKVQIGGFQQQETPPAEQPPEDEL